MSTKVVAAVREFSDYAGERGIVMALENHGACSADFILRLLLDVNHPWFKLNLDVGNFPVAGTQSEEAYRIAAARYEGGLSPYLSVLTSENNLIAQRRNVADLEGLAFTYDVSLVRALGGGWDAASLAAR